MNQIVIDAIVKNGHVEISNLPLPDLSKVKVLLFPEADLKRMSFLEAKELTKGIKDNLSDKVDLDRGDR